MRAAGHDFLAHTPVTDADIAAQGSFILRYGIRFLGKPFRSIVPGLVAIDYGTFLTGEEAWDFLLRRSNLYPRAEVFGYRDDGTDDQLFVRQLDLALTPQVLAYADAAAVVPLAHPAAWLGAPPTAPARSIAYLPVFSTLMDWKAAESHE